jgi:LCP family protein required for cell wall assembly
MPFDHDLTNEEDDFAARRPLEHEFRPGEFESTLNIPQRTKEQTRRRRQMALREKQLADMYRYFDVARYRGAEKSRQRKMGIRVALIAVLIMALSIAVAASIYVSNINARLSANVTDDLRDQLVESTPGSPFYLLLLGVDKDQGRVEDTENYGEDQHAYRSDSIMLCRIDPKNVKVTMVSIHRDTLIDMDNYGEQKINAAYAFGGAAYATEVVSTFADVPISHYGEVDLDRFIQIVDVVGGVTVDLPVPVYDPEYTGLDLPAGVQTLDGMTAALLCRCRHGYDAYGDGDRFRAANQRMVFSEVIKKVLASDPATMMNTVSAIADCVTTDLNIAEILDLASQMMTLNVETDIMTGMEPTDGVLLEDGWYEICLVDQWKKMMTRVDQGLPPYDETEGEHDSTAGIAGGVGEEGERAAEAAGTPEYVEPTYSTDYSSGYDGNDYGDTSGYAYDYSTTYYDGGDYSGDTGYTEEYVDYSEGGEVASEEVSYDESGGGGEEVATEEYTVQ